MRPFMRRNQVVSDLVLGAGPVEGMLATGFLIGSEEAIGELCAIVGEDGFDASGAGFAQGIQEIDGIFLGLIRINLILTFKQFPVAYVELLVRMAKSGTPGQKAPSCSSRRARRDCPSSRTSPTCGIPCPRLAPRPEPTHPENRTPRKSGINWDYDMPSIVSTTPRRKPATKGTKEGKQGKLRKRFGRKSLILWEIGANCRLPGQMPCSGARDALF
ncbi:MAG: hypothetical protein LBO00_00015 [Zoogloeaceae bacterium]|nr:hypothetical protein [Zoogloeaceae bacterium]